MILKKCGEVIGQIGGVSSGVAADAGKNTGKSEQSRGDDDAVTGKNDLSHERREVAGAARQKVQAGVRHSAESRLNGAAARKVVVKVVKMKELLNRGRAAWTKMVRKIRKYRCWKHGGLQFLSTRGEGRRRLGPKLLLLYQWRQRSGRSQRCLERQASGLGRSRDALMHPCRP